MRFFWCVLMRKIAIVGRTNVGKSALFNRLSKTRAAIVFDRNGVTRDVREVRISDIIFADTPGMFDYSANTDIANEICRILEIVISEADIFLFVIDCNVGITTNDKKIAEMLRKTNKQCVVICNKCDKLNICDEAYELGFDEYFYTSAEHNIGIDDVVNFLGVHNNASRIDNEDYIKIAVLGRPNAGKSTIINSLLGKQRRVVCDSPGATRETSYDICKVGEHNIVLVDTPGVRKRARVVDDLERLSVSCAVRACREADIILFVIDSCSVNGFILDRQDLILLNICSDAYKTVGVVFNKADLSGWKVVPKDVVMSLGNSFSQMCNVPVFAVCGKNRTDVSRTVVSIVDVYKNCHVEVKTSELNKLVQTINNSGVLHNVKIKYATQISINPQRFLFFVSGIKNLLSSQKRYIKKVLQERFELSQVPVQIIFRQSK